MSDDLASVDGQAVWGDGGAYGCCQLPRSIESALLCCQWRYDYERAHHEGESLLHVSYLFLSTAYHKYGDVLTIVHRRPRAAIEVHRTLTMGIRRLVHELPE
ncbi:MAG: hypothetical protein IIA27_05915 [Gemmatimonadetes bacterium]|nr:hypothetical protein [Gemmatimonadota bacterium]